MTDARERILPRFHFVQYYFWARQSNRWKEVKMNNGMKYYRMIFLVKLEEKYDLWPTSKKDFFLFHYVMQDDHVLINHDKIMTDKL
jgi:hypothetical protein